MQIKGLQKQLAMKSAELAKFKEDYRYRTQNFEKQEANLFEERKKIDDGNLLLIKQVILIC